MDFEGENKISLIELLAEAAERLYDVPAALTLKRISFLIHELNSKKEVWAESLDQIQDFLIYLFEDLGVDFHCHGDSDSLMLPRALQSGRFSGIILCSVISHLAQQVGFTLEIPKSSHWNLVRNCLGSRNQYYHLGEKGKCLNEKEILEYLQVERAESSLEPATSPELYLSYLESLKDFFGAIKDTERLMKVLNLILDNQPTCCLTLRDRAFLNLQLNRSFDAFKDFKRYLTLSHPNRVSPEIIAVYQELSSLVLPPSTLTL